MYEYHEGWPPERHTIYSSIESFGTEPQTNTDVVIYQEEYFKRDGTEVQPPDTDGKDVIFARFTKQLKMSPDPDYEELWIGVDIVTNPLWMSHNPLREVYIGTYATYATLAAPFFIPNSIYTNIPIDVTVTCAVEGVTIHYTTDGSDPTQADTIVPNGGTVHLERNTVLKARAWKAEWLPSAIGTSSNYTFVADTPFFIPNSVYTNKMVNVVVTTATDKVIIHYTTDESKPTQTNDVAANGGTVLVDRNMTLMAKAWREGWLESATGKSSDYILYVKKPVIDPPGGDFNPPTNAIVHIDTPGAQMYYTTNGVDPVVTDRAVTNGGSITIVMNVTLLKVRGFKNGWDPSDVTSAVFTVPEPVMTFLMLGCVAVIFRKS